jgi:hypothetical protein
MDTRISLFGLAGYLIDCCSFLYWARGLAALYFVLSVGSKYFTFLLLDLYAYC